MNHFSSPARRLACSVALGLWAALAQAGTPVPVDFPGATLASETGPVPPLIPIAKVLILPITAYDPEGNRLSFTASSNNPAVMVRVKTGNPLMRLTLHHAGSATAKSPADSPYNGDVVFQLFRDLTPTTAANIAGFVAGGFYDNLSFHRLADLNDPQNPAKPAPKVSSFIFQGGDPKGDGTGGPGFAFDNEYDASLIFAGRGQLAMANSGYDSNFRGTDGSQFFIAYDGVTLKTDGTVSTDGRPRFLDMGYTIFGQLTHGWKVLDDLRETPRWPYPPANADGSPGTAPSGETPDHPKVPVTITSASIVDLYRPDPAKSLAYTDAVLVLSATAPTTAKILVTISDNQTPPHVVTRTFEVKAAKDTANTKPFLSQLGDHIFPGGTEVAIPVTGTQSGQTAFDNSVLKDVASHPELKIPFKVVDLERDFVTFLSPPQSNYTLTSQGEPAIVNNATSFNAIGFAALLSNRTLVAVGNSAYQGTNGVTGYSGVLNVDLPVTQFDMTYRGTVDGSGPAVANYAAGAFVTAHTSEIGEPMLVTGAPGKALTAVTVAGFRSGNTRAAAGDVVAVVNWGDGSTTKTTDSSGASKTTANFPATAILPSSTPSSSEFRVTGTHTYRGSGIYPVTVTLMDNTAGGKPDLGLGLAIKSTAVISSGALSAVGRPISIVGRSPVSQTVATFTDRSGTGGGYDATVDWGDGSVTEGAVKEAGSEFKVEAAHAYRDPETYAVLVRIQKKGAANAADAAIAWSTAQVSGFTGQQHLPPFDQAHLVAQLSPAPVSVNNPYLGIRPEKTTIGNVDAGQTQTYLSYQIVILNSGNKESKSGMLRMYLSPDKKLNPARTLNANGTVATPADILLHIGASHDSAIIPPLPPGSAVAYYFEDSSVGDLRLIPPPNETGSGYNLLASLEYSDPIADNEPIDKVAVAGPINGFLVTPTTVLTDEAGTPTYFKVRLDKRPGLDSTGKNVILTVPVAVNASTSGIGTVSPATLTFDNLNWNQYQTVTVKGLPDSATTSAGATYNPANGPRNFTIDIGPATGGGILNGMVGPEIAATDKDISQNITTSVTSLTTTDPYGTGNTTSFNVALAQAPTAEVTIQLHAQLPTSTSGAPAPQAEGLLSVNGSPPSESVTLSFPPIDPAHPAVPPPLTQTVTVIGLDDGRRSGSTSYPLVFDPSQSDDPNFEDLLPGSMNVSNVHSSGPITLSNETVTTTDPLGPSNKGSFEVVLDRAPKAPVQITYTAQTAPNGKQEGLLSVRGSAPARSVTLTFPAGEPTPKQTVSVVGQNDGSRNDSFAYEITAAEISGTTDTHFKNVVPAPIYVTNEHPSPIEASVQTITTSDPRGSDNTASFSVTLDQTPSSAVTVVVHAMPSAGGQAEGLLSANGSTPAATVTLTFNPADATLTQSVTVTGQDDGSTSGTTDYTIVFGAGVSADSRFSGFKAEPIAAMNQHFP